MNILEFDIQRFREIINESDIQTLQGSDVADDISNDGNVVIIIANGGDDTIQNVGGDEILNGTTVTHGNNVLIYGNNGNDLIVNTYGKDISVLGGEGNDSILNSLGSGAWLIGNEGDDFISDSNGSATLYGYEGNDTLQSNFGNGVYIFGGAGNDILQESNGNGNMLFGGENDDYIMMIQSTNNLADGGNGNDTLSSSGGSNNTISGGEDNDYIYNESERSTVLGDSGNDTIWSVSGNFTFIHGGDDADILIVDSSQSATISGGYGDDAILVEKGSTNNTIVGGGNDDYIDIKDSDKNLIYYQAGDGLDRIIGFDENDTIKISDSTYSTVVNDGTLIVTVTGGGGMLIQDAGNMNINIQGTLANGNSETLPVETTINTGSSAVTGVSNDGAGNIYIALDDRTLTVEGGEGKTVKFKNDFISGGPLDVQFAHSLKINEEAKFYWGIGEDATLALNDYAPTAINVSLNNSNFNDTSNVAFYGDIKTIDARGYTGYALLSGKDNVDNVIYGNETSCAMWGGNGGNDTLIGGNGSDLFWYVNGGGIDIVQNANFNDTVRFDGITLDELVGGGGQIIGNDVKVELKNGGSLTVENARNSEVVFDFNDIKYAVNSSTGEWEFR